MAFRSLKWRSRVRAPDLSECLLLSTPHCALRFSADLLNLLKVANARAHVKSLLLCVWTMGSFPQAHYRDSICGLASKRDTSLPSLLLSVCLCYLFLLALLCFCLFLSSFLFLVDLGGLTFLPSFCTYLIPAIVLLDKWRFIFSYKSVWKWFMAPACDSVK